MGQTKYNLNALMEKENDLIKVNKRIDYIFNRFKIIKNSVDTDIIRRDNISNQFNSLVSDFQNLVENTYNSSKIINRAITEYSDGEQQIYNLLNGLLGINNNSCGTKMNEIEHSEASISGFSILQNWFEKLYDEFISKVTHIKKFFEDNGVCVNNKDYSKTVVEDRDALKSSGVDKSSSTEYCEKEIDLQDVDILSSSDLNNVIGLKGVYAYYVSRKNKKDEMLAILRAIDTIRQKEEYNGLYSSQDVNGKYMSIYDYRDSEIKTKISIVQKDLHKDKKAMNVFMTAMGLLAPPYNVISALANVAPEGGQSILDDDNTETPDALNSVMTVAGFVEKPKYLGAFFSILGGTKTHLELGQIKGYSEVAVSIESKGYVENFKFKTSKDNILFDARKEEPIKISVPAQWRYWNENHPSPDLWIKNDKIKLRFD